MNAAYATKQDLQGLEARLQQGFEHSISRAIEELGNMIKHGFDQVTQEFGHVHQEIGDVKLRLDQAAYRFELVELGRRVEVLERKSPGT